MLCGLILTTLFVGCAFGQTLLNANSMMDATMTVDTGFTSPVLPKPDLYTALVQVNIRCVNNPTTGLVCAAEYPDKCSEQWNFPNPCTPQNIDMNITKFVHPFDKTKFLMCGQLGKLYVVQCPQFEVFHEGCGQCIGESAGMTASCEVPLPPVVANPCTREAILANKLFFPFPRNLSMFIHCDIWGKPWERICTPGEVWSQWDVTCVLPHLSNPCNRPTTDINYLYKHPCNPRMFLQCDSQGHAHEVTCAMNRAFDEGLQSCQPFTAFPPQSDFTPFCEDYVFGFRTFHGNDGVPLPNDTEVINLNPNFVVGGTSTGTVNVDTTITGTGSGSLSWEEVRRTMAARGLTGTDAGNAQTGTGQTWADIRNTGTGSVDAGVGQTWADIRSQGGQGAAQTWQDIRTGNQEGVIDLSIPQQGGGGQTAWQDMRTTSGTNAWQDVRTGNAGSGGMLDIRGTGNQAGQGAATTWQDVRTGNAGSGGMLDVRGTGNQAGQGAATTWQDVRTGNAGSSGMVDVRGTGNQAGQGAATTWQDVRTGNAGSGGMVDVPGTGNQAGQGAATTWQDVRTGNAGSGGMVGTIDQGGIVDATGTVTDAGSATVWQDMRTQPGNAGSNAMVDVMGGANQGGAVDQGTGWQDIRTGNAGSNAMVDVMGGANQGGAVDAAATTWQDVRTSRNAGANAMVDQQAGTNQAGAVSQGSATTWQDIRQKPTRNTGFIDATGSQSGSVSVNGQSGSNVPTLDLRNQVGLTVDATKTTTIDVTGSGTRQAGGGDQTMQQLLNTWNRIISGGGTASSNMGQRARNTDPMLTNTLADKTTTLGAHQKPPLGMGKPIHPSQLKMYEFSEIPFSEPCTQVNLDEGRTHFRLKGDPHKFLQCGANGKMHKMPCSTVGRDWFDVYTNTCVDGPVHLPV